MNALLLCIDMHNGFHGSFLHVLEYGQYLKSIGYDVHIGSVFISSANEKVAEEEGFKVYPVHRVPLDVEFDLVYALHTFLFPALLYRGLKYKKAIAATLSAFGNIELIPPAKLWPYFDLITAVSEEVEYRYKHRFDISGIFTIIPNHIPLPFMNAAVKDNKKAQLEKVAVVSNHYVEELASLPRLAPFQVDLIGKRYNNIQRVTPELLKEYDAVISIGKTVQYCLGLGIPIFQYGRYGGCGYISPENMDFEERSNFSGRGSRRKLSSEEIITELQEGYKKASLLSLPLCKLARARYGVKELVDKQLGIVMAQDRKRPPLKKEALYLAESYSSILDYMIGALSISTGKLN